MTSDNYLSASEAARETGKSLPTIRQYLKSGKLPNARLEQKGKASVWLIPVADLHASGLFTSPAKQADPKSQEPSSELAELLANYREQVAALTAENRQLRERLTEAQEDKRDQRDLLKALTLQLETRETQETRRRLWGFGAR